MLFSAATQNGLDHLKLVALKSLDEVVAYGQLTASRIGQRDLIKNAFEHGNRSPLSRTFYGLENEEFKFDGLPRYVLVLTVRHGNVCQYVRGFGDRRPSPEELVVLTQLLAAHGIKFQYDPMSYL